MTAERSPKDRLGDFKICSQSSWYRLTSVYVYQLSSLAMGWACYGMALGDNIMHSKNIKVSGTHQHAQVAVPTFIKSFQSLNLKMSVLSIHHKEIKRSSNLQQIHETSVLIHNLKPHNPPLSPTLCMKHERRIAIIDSDILTCHYRSHYPSPRIRPIATHARI